MKSFLEELSTKVLKAHCKALGAATSGPKKDLVDRFVLVTLEPDHSID
jgi:hypothetical protein